jgi:lipopolysaccharide export system permease protein
MRSWGGYLLGVDRPILVRRLLRLFFWRWVLILLVILGVLQVLDLLSKADDLLAPAGATQAAVWRYLELRLPELTSQFAPFAALLSVLIVLMGLSNSNEVTAMRVGGLSAMRILAPFLFGCGLMALAHFAFHELVAQPASARLAAWESAKYEPSFSLTGKLSDVSANVFVAESGIILKAGRATRLGDIVQLSDVTLYERAPEGGFKRVVFAKTGALRNGRYDLHDLRSLTLSKGQAVSIADEVFFLPISADRLFARSRDPERSTLGELSRLISSMRKEGSPSTELETVFWRRFFRPTGALVMPFMGAVAGFGLARRGGAVFRLLIGGALGFSYFVFDSVLASFGELGVIAPLFAATAPLAVYAALGLAFVFSID